MLIILNFLIIVAFIIYLIYSHICNSKIDFLYVKFLVIAILIFTLQIINFTSQTKTIKLSNDFFEDVKTIEWQNEKNLKKLGFETSEDGKYSIIHKDTENFMCYIQVSKNEKMPSRYKNKAGIYYDFEEGSSGFFSFQRLFSNENRHVVRRYTLYIDDIEIYAQEDNYAKEELAFPIFLKELVQQQKTQK